MQHHDNRQRVGLIDYAALRQEVGIEQVLVILEFRPVVRKGPQLRGPCPIHKSSSATSRSFSVNLDRGVYKCFGCGSEGTTLDLCQAAFGGTLYEAAIDACQRLGIEPPRRK
ncbi:DNA primase [Posidoniimonas corsicana]|uniref:DNA primase n=1 Tax=Posidoniimonas corsicana TaxID=1938618 RepID=A0A5C5VFM5_9BACT|nr:CHC2 zinc finger domain-containing protein [Posidoniimonas corsicana]TWT37444.1 DNA primase [Posidoniimonas corsicana]